MFFNIPFNIPITFPDISDLNILSMYVPTCISPPRPVVPKSSTPATSLANLFDEQHTMYEGGMATMYEGALA